VWDIRTPNQSALTLRGHASDVNSVSFFPDGFALGTGSDDRTCKLFDTRCVAAMASFGGETIMAGVSSVAFSRSGRLLFGGYEDHTVRGWDLFADPTAATASVGSGACGAHLIGHENRVSSLSMSPSGDALLTSSWDTMLRVRHPPCPFTSLTPPPPRSGPRPLPSPD
jgi:guanine nucleotide-binding protein G(I)/G(S)/G(T) subunit beta-1